MTFDLATGIAAPISENDKPVIVYNEWRVGHDEGDIFKSSFDFSPSALEPAIVPIPDHCQALRGGFRTSAARGRLVRCKNGNQSLSPSSASSARCWCSHI
jgi:hypothetical protein